MNLEERKKTFETLFSQKIQELQNIENYKILLVNEINQIKGKIDLISELRKESKE